MAGTGAGAGAGAGPEPARNLTLATASLSPASITSHPTTFIPLLSSLFSLLPASLSFSLSRHFPLQPVVRLVLLQNLHPARLMVVLLFPCRTRSRGRGRSRTTASGKWQASACSCNAYEYFAAEATIKSMTS